VGVSSGIFEFFTKLTYAVSLSNPLGLGLIFLMGMMTDIGIPLLLTLEIFLLFASFYVGPLSLQVFLIVAMLVAGREAGAAVLYWVSYTLGDPFLHWIQRHFPWFMKGIRRVRNGIRTRPILMVVAVRLTPGFLQIPSLISGSLRLGSPRFAIGVAVSSLIYDFGLVAFGFVASIFFKNARQDLQSYFIIFLISSIIVMWLILFFRFRNIFNDKGGV
jgi:membrane protein DedA with SNARE-associated domain